MGENRWKRLEKWWSWREIMDECDGQNDNPKSWIFKFLWKKWDHLLQTINNSQQQTSDLVYSILQLHSTKNRSTKSRNKLATGYQLWCFHPTGYQQQLYQVEPGFSTHLAAPEVVGESKGRSPQHLQRKYLRQYFFHFLVSFVILVTGNISHFSQASWNLGLLLILLFLTSLVMVFFFSQKLLLCWMESVSASLGNN